MNRLHKLIALEKTFFDKRLVKLLSLCFVVTVYTVLVGRHINPIEPGMFDIHDETQAGRIEVFAQNIGLGQIPPRIGAQYSWNLGFPVFNYYAPTPYWIGSFFYMLTQDAVSSLKWAFLASLVSMLITMFFFVKHYFGWYVGLVTGILWATSPYTATEVVIRGNLGELWWMAFFPLSLLWFIKLSEERTMANFFFSSVSLFLLFTVHNLFSLASLGLFLVLSLLFKNKLLGLLTIICGLLLGSYFLIPATLEIANVQAREVSSIFNYNEHFLCLHQLWSTPAWNSSGVSTKGCDDLMPFILGKIHIILGILGLVFFFFATLISFRKKSFFSLSIIKTIFEEKHNDINKTFLFVFALVGLLSLLLVLEISKPVWDLFSFILELYQFPWRFNLFILFTLCLFGGYFIYNLGRFIPICVLSIFFAVGLVTINEKYFIKLLNDPKEYRSTYASEFYYTHKIAYNFREYISSKANYDVWYEYHPLWGSSSFKPVTQPFEVDSSKVTYKLIEDSLFYDEFVIDQSANITINKHYLPNWVILVNGEKIIPGQFDDLGRPIVAVEDNSNVIVKFQQTHIQHLSNTLTLIMLISLVFMSSQKRKTLIAGTTHFVHAYKESVQTIMKFKTNQL